MIHPTLQGAPEMSGGTTIRCGDPIFKLVADGSDLHFAAHNVEANERMPKYKIEYAQVETCPELLYPMFISEAAYNEKDIAFMLMRKLDIDVEIIRVPALSLKDVK